MLNFIYNLQLIKIDISNVSSVFKILRNSINHICIIHSVNKDCTDCTVTHIIAIHIKDKLVGYRISNSKWPHRIADNVSVVCTRLFPEMSLSFITCITIAYFILFFVYEPNFTDGNKNPRSSTSRTTQQNRC